MSIASKVQLGRAPLGFVIAAAPALVFVVLPLAAQESGSRAAVPGDEAQAKAMAVVKELYGEEYARAKSAVEKRALAIKLLEKATATNDDLPAKYVLLKLARDIALPAGDGDTAFRALDAMDVSFSIDLLEMKTAALKKLATLAKAVEEHESIAGQAASLAHAAVAEENFERANEFAALALAEWRKARNTALTKLAAQRIVEVKEAALLYQEATNARAVLAKTPDDSRANLTLGKYLCFIQGQWQNGLGHLARGSDENLKAIAVKDQSGPASPEAQAAVADLWWQLAEEQHGATKPPLLARAGHWYEKALPGLSGLAKDKAQRRIETIKTVVGAVSPGVIARNAWVDLLKAVDIARDAKAGQWKWDGKALVARGNPETWLQLPVQVEGAYDLEVVFIRHEADNDVRVALPIMSRQITMHLSAYSGQASGFQPIGGETDLRKNASCRQPGQLVNGQPYTLRIRVRPATDTATIEVTLNGKPYLQWSGKQELLGNFPGFSKSPVLGGWYAPATYRSARFCLISGSASWTH